MIVVTGAAGAVGSFMVERLQLDGREVLPLYRADLESVGDATARLGAADRIEAVFHFASVANVRASFDNPKGTISNNIDCTLNLLEALRRRQVKPKLVLASTPEVYGVTPPLPSRDHPRGFDEGDPIAPANPYAASKAAQEAIVRAYGASYDIPFVITRAGSYINPRRDDLALSSFARQIVAAERQPARLFGGGATAVVRHGNLDTVRPWCDVRDIVDAYLLAAEKGVPGETYNIAAPAASAIRLGDVLNQLVNLSHIPTYVRLEPDPRLIRATDIGYQGLHTERFTRATGWKPSIPLGTSLTWLLNSFRERE